ncbi:Ras-related protein RABF2a [Linum grandiflorum]
MFEMVAVIGWITLICIVTKYYVIQLLLGDPGAGKSSLVLRFVKNQFVEFQASFDRAKKWVQELQAQDSIAL